MKRIVLTALAVVAIDQGTKAMSPSSVGQPAGGTIGNPGSLAGAVPFEGGAALLLAVLVLAAFGIVVPRLARRGMVSPIVIGLLVGGALGNIADRFALGHVRDFIWTPWLVFNLADVALLIGTVGFMGGVVVWGIRCERPVPDDAIAKVATSEEETPRRRFASRRVERRAVDGDLGRATVDYGRERLSTRNPTVGGRRRAFAWLLVLALASSPLAVSGANAAASDRENGDRPPSDEDSLAASAMAAGSVSDDVGVAAVRLEIYDQATTPWWIGVGRPTGRPTVDATVVGGDWTYQFRPDSPSPPQPSCWVVVRSFDAAGDPSPYANFTAQEPTRRKDV